MGSRHHAGELASQNRGRGEVQLLGLLTVPPNTRSAAGAIGRPTRRFTALKGYFNLTSRTSRVLMCTKHWHAWQDYFSLDSTAPTKLLGNWRAPSSEQYSRFACY